MPESLVVSDESRDLIGKFLSKDSALPAAENATVEAAVAASEVRPTLSSFPAAQPAAHAPVLPAQSASDDAPFPKDLEIAPVVPAATVNNEAAEQAEIAKFDPKSKAAIIKERAANKQLREEIEALRNKPASSTSDEELAQLRQKVTEYETKYSDLEQRIGEVSLAESPAFKDAFDNKITALYQRGMKILMQDGLAQEDAHKIIQAAATIARPSEREALFSNEASGVAVTLATLFNSVDELKENRQVALTNWKATKVAQEESSSQNMTFASRTRIKQDVAEAVQVLRSEKNGFYMESPANQEWNQGVQQRVSLLEGVLQRSDPKQIVRLVADGLTAPEFRKLYTALSAKYNTLKAEVDARDARNLPLNGRGYQSSLPTGPAPSKVVGETIEDAVKNFMK